MIISGRLKMQDWKVTYQTAGIGKWWTYFHLSHMAVHHHLHFFHYNLYYHNLHLLLLVQSFILNLKLGFSANHFLRRPFPFLPD